MAPHDHQLTDHPLRPQADQFGQKQTGPWHASGLIRAETNADVVARLELLDDLIFAAIDGDPAALEEAAGAWKKTLADLGAPAVEESRRQYLRRAQSVWNALRHEPNHPPHKVFAAIEVISLLAGKAW